MPDPGQKSDLADQLTKRLGLITAIVGVFVTANATLSSCSRDAISRSESFRAAVKSEEDYWSRLYKDYIDTFDEKDQAKRALKLAALTDLANHTNPQFEEFSSGLFGSESQRRLAVNRLDEMKKSLKDALGNKTVSPPQVVQTVTFDAEQDVQEKERQAAASGEPAPAASPTTTAEIVSPLTVSPSRVDYGTKLLAAGDPKGWDIDIFWCAGSNEQVKFSYAMAAATVLATRARAGRPIQAGVSLGRIRVRTLPVSRQAPSGIYPNAGILLTFDSGAGEREAAEAVRTLLGARNPTPRLALSTGAPTESYLSMFVCSPSGPSPKPTRTAEAAARTPG